ncbi:MAG TPA: exopolysaccharide production repressor protein [Rhizobiaceae bacterium]|nr:exopolysaccharide production repressor protein [Rhizobiaceae bacterium]
MSFPRFLVGMVSVLLVFAVTTYAMTGSLGSTLLQTVICAVLIQVGYFLAILFLVARSERETVSGTRKTYRGKTSRPDSLAAKIRHITDRLRSHHS